VLDVAGVTPGDGWLVARYAGVMRHPDGGGLEQEVAMKYIALEEAFDIPELAARRSAPPGAGMRFVVVS
jgi:hypothetical protein